MIWQRLATGWTLRFIAAESAALAGIGYPGQWGLYWAERDPFAPIATRDRRLLARYWSATPSPLFPTIEACDE